MSNARSPRDVCSTTMGTRGLIALASFRLVFSNPSGERESERSPKAAVRWASLATVFAVPNGFSASRRSVPDWAVSAPAHAGGAGAVAGCVGGRDLELDGQAAGAADQPAPLAPG